jgi:predicted transcriptional regulator
MNQRNHVMIGSLNPVRIRVLKTLKRLTDRTGCPSISELASYFAFDIRTMQDYLSGLFLDGYLLKTFEKGKACNYVLTELSEKIIEKF